MARLIVSTRQEGYGAPDYWCRRVDATLNSSGDWDGMILMLHNMITYVGPMLAGDMVRVSVFIDGKLCGSFRGRPQREDKQLRRLADHVTCSWGSYAAFKAD